MRTAIAWLLGLAAGLSHAQAPQWWLGFVDTRNHAFLELPAEAKGCAARTAAVKRLSSPSPGMLVAGALKPEGFVPPGARLVFGVTDLRGRYAERVLPRVAAVVRMDESEQGACWYLAETGTEAAGYVAEEDVLALATLPPRRLELRMAQDDWRAWGETEATNDSRYAAMAEAPAPLRARIDKMMPGYTQVYSQGFTAVLEKGAAPRRLRLIGAINDGAGAAGKGQAYNTLNMIVFDGEEAGAPLYSTGPSGGVAVNRAGSFVGQAVAAADLDGDGVDEIVLRARYFSGGNLKVLKFVKGAFAEIRQSAYEGE